MKILNFFPRKFLNMNIGAHLIVLAASFIALGVVNGILDASYEASNHPVSYAEGQTTFDGEQIKGFYSVMDQAGTLSVYVRTQLIDFGFIAAMAVLGVSLGAMLIRINRERSFGQRAGQVVSGAALIGASADVLENLVSFVMLANPAEFPNWLAIPYSSFAVIKFAFITLAMVAVVASVIGWALGRLQRA